MDRTQLIENAAFFGKRAEPLLNKNENLFLNRLIYWSTHKKNYGVQKYGGVWIYNALDDWAEQLRVSKSSVRRAISSLKSKKIIDSKHLSANKRDRTLFYSVNYEKLKSFLESEASVSCVQKTDGRERMAEHMAERMYNNNNKDINKSNKSKKIVKKVLEDSGKDSPKPTVERKVEPEEATQAPKTTIVQDMLKIWNEEFPSNKIVLTKQLARYLVAAFKTKFDSSPEKWKRYLKLLKTSAFIMKEGFKLFIGWALKFDIIDKLKSGWLGTREAKIPVEESKIAESAERHVESVDETEKCKETRRKIIKKLSPAIYNSWFAKIELAEEKGRVFLKKPENRFLHDYITLNFLDKIGLEFLESGEGEKPATLTTTDRKSKNVPPHVSNDDRSRESLQLMDVLARCFELKRTA